MQRDFGVLLSFFPADFKGGDEDEDDNDDEEGEEDGEDEEEEEEDDDDEEGEDEEEENQRRYDFRQRKTAVRYQAPLDGTLLSPFINKQTTFRLINQNNGSHYVCIGIAHC